LAELPRELPAAIAVVQHLPKGFARAFAEFLQGRIGLPVAIVTAPTSLRAGSVYLAPDDQHLTVADNLQLVPSLGAPVEGHRPAIDVLFQSLARVHGPRAAGVVMSGIGRDGVTGLLSMRARGALTLAQDQASCGVFGIPRAALEAKAAEQALDPSGIARALRDWARSTAEKRAGP
jgi:two-component system chemotaxis response regulator CheB